MFRSISFTVGALLVFSCLVTAQGKQGEAISNKTIQTLQANGFEFLGMHKSVRPPMLEDKGETLASKMREIAVRMDLSKTSINPIYLERQMQANSTKQTVTDTILIEDAEGEFPGERWQLSRDVTWGKTDHKKHSGSYSLWCAAGGDSAIMPGNGYPNNLQSMMVFGPFDLSDVNYAQLSFWYSLDTELEDDWFFYMFSIDGLNFSGVGLSGSPSGSFWVEEKLPLINLPGLGNVTGQPQVWLAFLFESDSNSTNDQGAFIDDIILHKRQISGTPVAGAVSGEWLPVNNPYVAPLDVGIVAGDTLEIFPGVEIRFDESTQFIAGGSLYAIGTVSDSIIFTSNKSSPAPGDWEGIGFYSADSSLIQFSIIEYAGSNARAIYSGGHSLHVENSLIRQNKGIGIFCEGDISIIGNTIRQNDTGIAARFAAPRILRNTLENNNGTGVSLAFSPSPLIENNQINYNGSIGITFGDATPIIVDNIIKGNASYGINGAAGGAIGIPGNIIVAGNQIIENSDHGINLGGLSISASVTQNIIVANKDGIHVTPGFFGLQPEMKIYNNTIVANNQYGMNFLDGDLSTTLITNNIVTQNQQAGISAGGKNSSVSISFNNVFDNFPNFAVANQDSLGVLVLTNTNGNSIDIYSNLSEDPLFVDPATGNYKLRYVENGFPENSPCRDAGNINLFYNDENGSLNDIGYTGGSRITTNFTSHDFGGIVAGLTKQVRLDIFNNRDMQLSISRFELSDSLNLSISPDLPVVLPAFGRTSVNITFSPQGVETFHTQLQIYSSGFLGDSVATVELIGTGLPGTFLQGNIKGVLRKESNPYIVIGDITVSADDTLLIMPGVEMLFNGGYGLNVFGVLQAIGTPTDSITFSLYELSRIFWKGIKFDHALPGGKLEYCLIERTSNFTVQYGGIQCIQSSPSIRNNSIANCFGHSGSGIIVLNESNPTISKNYIYNNSADQGATGILVSNSSPTITNNIIADGFQWGMTIAGSTSHPLIHNNTIYGNRIGGVVFVSDSLTDMRNNIVWGNGGTQIRQQINATPSITYCNVQGGWPGEGNIDADPLFVDPRKGRFLLQPTSPCIDAGDPNSLFNDPEDPNNVGFALFPAQGTIRNDMGVFGGPQATGIKVNRAPAPFRLLAPAEGDTVATDSILFTWRPALDPDPGDQVTYTLSLDSTAAFEQPAVVNDIADTAFVLTDAFENNTRYFWTVAAFDNFGNVTASLDTFSFFVHMVPTGVENPETRLPTIFALAQNYPNPFNPETTIKYQLPRAAQVKLEIHNVLGQKVIVLVDRQQPAGYYSIVWNGKNDSRKPMASGIYLYRLQADDFVDVKKLMLLR